MNTAHSIPKTLEETAKADMPAFRASGTGDSPGEPSHAERARTLVEACEQGFLATICRDPQGFPFGSVVKHAVQSDGAVLLCLSDLAEHSKNLLLDRRSSLMCVEPLEPGADPLAAGRVTLVGPVDRLSGADEVDARAAYLRTFPGAYFADFDDFHMYRLDVESIRYVGGFGKMSWVRASDFLSASPDPLRTHAAGIVDHMNNDHSDALVLYGRAFGDLPEISAARMTAVDRYGFEMTASWPEGERAVRIPFGESLSAPDQVRQKMIEMLATARRSVAS